MKRNIKFRGKRKDNNEWVYGSFVKLDYHNSIDYIECSQIVLENGHVFEVNPETVDEYTGLNDKSDIEIFENDIVQDEFSIDAIHFHEGEFKKKSGNECGCSIGRLGTKNMEILGNIHENIKLL